MRAIVMREPGPASVLRVEDVAVPVPGRRDVLIRVAACGVCGHDLVHRRGTKRDAGLPCIPGHEVAGTIVEVGSDVRHFAPGQRVATTQRYHICMACRWCRGGEETLCREMRFLGEAGMVGGYAQFVAVEEDNVAPVPDGVPLVQAAIAACAIGTVLNAVRDVAHVSLGERVLVTGAGGGLGVHAAQLARSAGAHVIAQTHSANKAAGLASLGIDDVMITAPGEDFSERVRALTGSEGVDVLIDNVGTPLFDAMRRSLAISGRWILVGQVTGDFVRFNPAQLFLRNQSMLSVHSTSRAQLVDSLRLIARGAIKPVIAATYPLEEAAAAHEFVEHGAALGRVVLRVSE